MALWGAALAASFCPLSVQVLFAVIAIGIIGMAHGASDLDVVQRRRRLPFLALYGAVIALCLLWWHRAPGLALPGFLIASAVHFALEDAPHGGLTERLARGITMIAAPATLHLPAFRSILHQAGLASVMPGSVTAAFAILGGIGALGLTLTGLLRRDGHLIAGILALLLLPPFVGFSMGFLILHALPQTRLRRDQLGFTTYAGYLHLTWPILTAAIVLASLIIYMMLPGDAAGIRSLFAALAALALPHMLVTPWFEPPQQA